MYNYIFDAVKNLPTGLSLHYPTLYSLVVGLETKAAFEFGAGISTRVILNALKLTNGKLYSCSTDFRPHIESKFNISLNDNWVHRQGTSDVELEYYVKDFQLNDIKFDFVLHDGAHNYRDVKFDLSTIIPFMKQYSLLVVHDTLHSSCGSDMRCAIDSALDNIQHSQVTLPFGYGLTIIKIEGNEHNDQVSITRNKPTSKFITELL